jgi:hypothetical protein
VVPHLATNWAISRLSAQIGRDAEFSRFYGRGYLQRPETNIDAKVASRTIRNTLNNLLLTSKSALLVAVFLTSRRLRSCDIEHAISFVGF